MYFLYIVVHISYHVGLHALNSHSNYLICACVDGVFQNTFMHRHRCITSYIRNYVTGFEKNQANFHTHMHLIL